MNGGAFGGDRRVDYLVPLDPVVAGPDEIMGAAPRRDPLGLTPRREQRELVEPVDGGRTLMDIEREIEELERDLAAETRMRGGLAFL